MLLKKLSSYRQTILVGIAPRAGWSNDLHPGNIVQFQITVHIVMQSDQEDLCSASLLH